MNPKVLYNYLKLIQTKGSIRRITRLGANFNEIAEVGNESVKLGLVTFENNQLVLTSVGVSELERLEVIYKKRNKEEWIELDTKNKIPKLDKKTIFLPNQNELKF